MTNEFGSNPIDYRDPEWATKITVPQFLEQQRPAYAAGTLTEKNVKLLERSFPGWYDSWSNSEPMSEEGYSRRNAIADAAVASRDIKAYNHADDPIMVFENTTTGVQLLVELTGTDSEMRTQTREVVEKLSAS